VSDDLIPYDVGPGCSPSGRPFRNLIPRHSNDLATWLRRCIEERKYLAENTIRLGNSAEWTELSSGVLMTCRPDDPQARLDGLHPLGDSTLTRLMEANDPRDTIARCEAELAILDEHATKVYRGAVSMFLDDYWCQTCDVPGDQPARTWCRTVRLLASGYQHRPGYQESWRP
jgi:Family of unknown function (DUF6221)